MYAIKDVNGVVVHTYPTPIRVKGDQFVADDMVWLDVFPSSGATVAVLPDVPASVTRRQAKQALYLAGKLTAVEAALNALADPAKTLALIYWTEAATFDRNHPLIIQMTPVLGTSADVDQLFITAAGL